VVALIIVLVVVVLLVASVVFYRRHGEGERPRPDWRPTDEVFNDPSTNRVMRVWVDGAGERHYVPEGYRKTA
jgi:hypothetical protein